MVRACIKIAALLTAGALVAQFPSAALAASPQWEIFGKTYNSVAFLDRGSVTGAGSQTVRTIRVSGQPEKDRWIAANQDVSVDCAKKRLGDAGSVIENSDGSIHRYPGTAAYRTVPEKGIFAQLFDAVCNGRAGTRVTDPKSWTRLHFRPGD